MRENGRRRVGEGMGDCEIGEREKVTREYAERKENMTDQKRRGRGLARRRERKMMEKRRLEENRGKEGERLKKRKGKKRGKSTQRKRGRMGQA